MAENEDRIETLEDEVKVLKGEVKRTLVDLRSLLMREDSPLGEAALAARRSGAALPVAESLPTTEKATKAATKELEEEPEEDFVEELDEEPEADFAEELDEEPEADLVE